MSAEELPRDEVSSVLRGFLADVEGEQRLEVDVDGRRHTVDLRPIYSFEKDILDRLIGANIDTSVTGGAVPVKGEWVHGWLNVQFDDYINNIWKNYQFFVKYIEARTSNIENISTYQRSPGTYDSMYRYILLLEDLDLVDRYKREEVDSSEYDFPVPEEFRTRTFVKLESDFETNKEKWRNPYEANYPDGEKPEDSEDRSDDGDEDTEETPEEVEDPEDPTPQTPDVDIPKEDIPEPDTEPQGLTGDASDAEPGSLPDEDASITDFEDTTGLLNLVENAFPEAINRTFADSPGPTLQIEEQDFGLGRVAVFDKWATGNAKPGEDPLELFVSVDDRNANISPTFILTGMQEHLPDVLSENNPYPGVFPRYFVTSVYNSVFKDQLEQRVRGEQSNPIYYNLTKQEMEEI